ncbi:MAG: transcription elongation factor GreA [Bacteriovoracaceae bacterium]
MNSKNPITQAGMEKIKSELDQLIKVDREEVKIKIAEAREHGDLKENAEYHAAKEKQSVIEGRISQLQGTIANSQVIDTSTIESERIVFGASVKLIDEDGNELNIQVVGQEESDSSRGKISFQSPLGKALIGRETGDTVIVKAPKGDIEYEVDSFEFK